MNELLVELEILLKAHTTLFWLGTWEERRVLSNLKLLGERCGRRVHAWSATQGFVPPHESGEPAICDPLEALEAMAAMQGPSLVAVLDLHPYLEDARVVRKLRELEATGHARGQAIFLVGPVIDIPRELEKSVAAFEVPLPDLPHVTRLLAVLAKTQGLQIEVTLFEQFVKASLGLTEEEIKKVFMRVLAAGNGFAVEDLPLVIEEKQKLIRKHRFLEYLPLDHGLDDVGGLDQLKEWMVQRREAFTERARSFGLPPPKGLFLLGVQGCGKSLTAKAAARLWHLPLLRLDMGALVALEANEGGMGDAIRVAESMAPLVLWIDEIEKAFSGIVAGTAEPGVVRAFGRFISWLQEKKAGVFVIATANQVEQLPPELLRKGRFDELFFVDLPNVHERESIFSIHLRNRQRDPDDFELWSLAEASEKFSGAEIEQVIVAALFSAFRRDRALTTADLQRALRDTVPLARTLEDRIKSLREWARKRCRPATFDRRRIDFFAEWEEAAEPGDPGSPAAVGREERA